MKTCLSILTLIVTLNVWGTPLAHWKFDESSGTTAVDSAGSNDGTVSGAS